MSRFVSQVDGGGSPVTITGGNKVGDVLTANPAAGWQFTTGQWYLDGAAVGSSTAGLTLTQLSAAIGKAYGFQPTGVPFRATAPLTVAAAAVAPTVATAAVITGTPTVGTPLSITSATFNGTAPITIVRTIFANSVLVATASGYTPVSGDIGKVFTVVDTATNTAGSAPSMSANSAACVAGGLSPYFVMDNIGGVYQSNGVTYASEAAMNTALGATKTGEARVYPSYVDPASPELVTNGAFTGGDISGWTAGQFSGSGASIAAGTGGNADRLVLNTGGATQAFARQTKQLSQGRAFRLQASVQRDTLTGQPSLAGGYQTTFQNRQGFKQFTPAQGVQQVGELVTAATQTGTTPSPDNVEPALFPASVSFGAGSNANTETSGIYVFDNVSIKECVVLPGATSGRLGAICTFTTPASFTKTETVLQFGIDGNSTTANSEATRIRLSIDASGNLTYSAQVKTIVAASQLLGTLSPSTRYSVWLHNGPDTFGVRLGASGQLYCFGAASNFASSIASKVALEFIPGLGLMWQGRSAISGANVSFTGVIDKTVLYGGAIFAMAVTDIAIGDSLAGSGASSTDGTSLGAYYGPAGPWSSCLARSLTKPHKCIVFSWGGKYASDVRGAFGVVLAADGLRTPAQFPSLLDGLAPYADNDPRVIIDMSYNLMNAAGSLSDANAKATSNYNTVMGMINDIHAVYPQITKFMVIGCRAGSFDVNWQNGGYKKAGMNTLNALYASGQSSGANVPYVFHDLHADLIDPAKGLVWGGVTTPTAQDVTDYGNGIIPESLRADQIHPSGPSFGTGVTPYAGVKAETESKRRAFLAAGWDNFSTAGTIYALAA